MAPQDDSRGRFDDDLIGMDPQDPEVRRFAEHLDRMEHPTSPSTVEGMLRGFGDFADSANRARGHRRFLAVTVVLLVVGPALLGLVWAVLRFTGQLLGG